MSRLEYILFSAIIIVLFYETLPSTIHFTNYVEPIVYISSDNKTIRISKDGKTKVYELKEKK